jgi:ribosomal-protein-alanine N-acetyltransferase
MTLARTATQGLADEKGQREMGIPTLQTARLRLRGFDLDDVEPLYNILQVPAILRYFPNPDPPPREKVERLITHQLGHWDDHGYGWWAVELPDRKELMGWCGLTFLPETGETEVAYLLAKPHWGQGYATEAAWASLQYGVEHVDVEQIIGLTHPENVRSQRVLLKLGMSFVNQAEYFGMQLYRYAIELAAIRSGHGGEAVDSDV